jgi:hypothetical protein
MYTARDWFFDCTGDLLNGNRTTDHLLQFHPRI